MVQFARSTKHPKALAAKARTAAAQVFPEPSSFQESKPEGRGLRESKGLVVSWYDMKMAGRPVHSRKYRGETLVAIPNPMGKHTKVVYPRMTEHQAFIKARRDARIIEEGNDALNGMWFD